MSAINVGIMASIPVWGDPECFINKLLIDWGHNLAPTIDGKYLFGIITIFVLFFSITQFGFSKSNLPAKIMQERVLKNNFTRTYIGLQLSFSTIVAFYVYLGNSYWINYFYCIICVFVSVILSILYFFWLISNLTNKGLAEFTSRHLSILTAA
jgi:hypothetical protein